MPRRVFWSAVWLAIVLVMVKAYYLGRPSALGFADAEDYVRSVAAISYVDVLFAAASWGCARALLTLVANRPLLARCIAAGFAAFAALACLYAVANVAVFGAFGGFLTYPLFALIGNVRMIRSSVAMYLTPRVASAIICLPIAYLTLVWTTLRLMPVATGSRWRRNGLMCASLGAWVMFGQHAFTTEWATRQGHRIAENPHWVLLASWWQAVNRDGTVRIADRFPPDDLADFQPASPSASDVVRRISDMSDWPPPARSVKSRPLNVILVILESVADRWTSLNDRRLYDATPGLAAESSRALVFDNFYAHIGRSSNSLAAILLSAYPKLDFRDLTEEYPRMPGTSLAASFRERGYRTGFITPSDMQWADWDRFLASRGFDELRDYHRLACTDPLSSWGVEDRCMVDAMIQFVEQNRSQPFFLMGWTQQTHHPYEPTPGVAPLDVRVAHEPVPDDYDLERYLNVLHETDRHVERLFETIRRLHLEQDTMVVVTGDHGQAFGYPHDSYMQGHNVYEEDVHVPLMFWAPRMYRSAVRSGTLGSHVDLAPTIAALAGLPAAPDWQGRSLFATDRARRAYFYVAEDHFTLGVRERNWKYIFDLREGSEELYDLNRDPLEHLNLASAEPERCARLRQRLAAWTEANRRQYERVVRNEAPKGAD